MDPCGYSVVSVGAGPTPLAQGATWATLEEQRQTVPRAELAAVILILTHVSGPILVHVDCKSIHSKWTCKSLKATAGGGAREGAIQRKEGGINKEQRTRERER